ncbi:MAG: AMP-binding protein, partial [Flavobacteriaceae bacterium]|nr:AMP-binding protein [Flavobacteriaceae bacterium]
MIRKALWIPDDQTIKKSNIYQMMLKNGLKTYEDLWNWSVKNKNEFWSQTVTNLGIKLFKEYDSGLDSSLGVEQTQWLKGGKLNIIDSCFQNDDNAIAVIFQKEGGTIEKVTQIQLENYVNKIANGLRDLGIKKGDLIAIDMPMTLEAVAIYLAGIKAGNPVVTIADSFTSNEIEIRLKITKPKVVFTQDVLQRSGKTLPLYKKIKEIESPKAVVIKVSNDIIPLRKNDLYFNDFLSDNDQFKTVIQNPDDIITVLFSSGTTGKPKAIPWTHTTPIKGASDGFYHQNIQKNDVICWPTNLGWMMGPWL